MKKALCHAAFWIAAIAGATDILVAPSDFLSPETNIHSVKAAIDAATKIKEKTPDEPINLIFRGGVYFLDEPIVLRANLSRLTLKAYPGEEVIFDGGVLVKNWQKRQLNGKEVLVAPIPEKISGKVDQLFVNGKRAAIASIPKAPQDSIKITQPRFANADDPDAAHIGFTPGKDKLSIDCYNPTGIDVHLISHWFDIYFTVDNFDKKTGILWLNGNIAAKIHRDNFGLHAAYILHNVREALTEPGEFYCDTLTREIYYLPREGESVENIQAAIPRRSAMFIAYGDNTYGKLDKVRDVVIDGITFRHGGYGKYSNDSGENYDFVGAGRINNPRIVNDFCLRYNPGQAAAAYFAQVVFYLAENCAIRNCTVENGGMYGIGILSGCRNMTVSGNTLRELGGGGIIVNGVNTAAYPESATRITESVSVINNHIYDIGKIYMQSVGVFIGFARGNLVEHNEIHDTYYSGISAGWNWGFAPTTGSENRIGYNHIYNIGQGVLCDMGGIYLMSIQPGTRVYNNLIHNVKHRVYGGWGIYSDAGSSHQVIEKNVCYDCSSHGWHQNYGRENIVRNNLFAFNSEGGFKFSYGKSFTRGYQWKGENYSVNGNVFRNIVVTDNIPFAHSSIPFDDEKTGLFCDLNWYFDLSGNNTAERGFAATKPCYKTSYSLAQWRDFGFDKHTVVADPGFVDAAKRDFHYRSDSAAKAAGFYDFAETLDKAGLLKP